MNARSGLAGAVLAGTMSLSLMAAPAQAAPAPLVAAPAVVQTIDDTGPQGLLHNACDANGCPKIGWKKFMVRKWNKGKLGSRPVNVSDWFKYPKVARKMMVRRLENDLLKRYGKDRSKWPYGPKEGVGDLLSERDACVHRGGYYSPYTYGIGVCQSRTPDIKITKREAWQGIALVACGGGAYVGVILSGGAAAPLLQAGLGGTGCFAGAMAGDS